VRRPTSHRLHLWIGLAVVVGAATGAVVALLHWFVEDVIWGPLSVMDSRWVVLLPLLGLALVAFAIRLTPSRSTETTEAYIETFHDPQQRLKLSEVPLRLLASVATIAFGGSLGLEGPSIYVGSAFGDTAERRFPTLLLAEHQQVLLVAGAAAGVSAIFKAPLTGIVFALEVPYRDDLARRALIPAVFASAASYLVFAAFQGTRPFFPVASEALNYRDLVASILVGVAAGVVARIFVAFMRMVGRWEHRMKTWLRVVVGGTALITIGLISLWLYHAPLALGPGYHGMTLAAEGQLALGSLLALLVLKVLATAITAGSGGVGGLFFPSAMIGAVVGAIIGTMIHGPASLFAVVGIASFLSGAYNVPLAGSTFVAETTGTPGYIIPGLLAAAIAYLVSGRDSLSAHQRARM
jgi:CIC family chloride channel protein